MSQLFRKIWTNTKQVTETKATINKTKIYNIKTILRISEAANELGICVKTIKRWDLVGLIDCFRTIGC